MTAKAAAPATEALVAATNLRRTFGKADAAVHALTGVTTARRGAVHGDRRPVWLRQVDADALPRRPRSPDGGSVLVDGDDLATLGDNDLTRVRRDKIGFIFQAFNLLPVLSARENVELPLRLGGAKIDGAWIDELIETVGLTARHTTARPS
ncbi:MAG: hypothetical protein QM679_12585 [Patulibacter sp.]